MSAWAAMSEPFLISARGRQARNVHAENLQNQEGVEQQHHRGADHTGEMREPVIGELSHDVASAGEDQQRDHGKRQGDAEHDLVVALQRWVEQGVAPTRIIATKFNGDDHAKGVAITRPLCPFPQVAKYKGSGSTDDAANFMCAMP